MRHGNETLDAMDVAIGYLERSGMDVSDEWRHDANGPLLVADDDGTTILATVTLAGADPNGVPMLNVTDDDAKRMRREVADPPMRVDLVQVVRCRDCKYVTDEGYGCKYFSHYEQGASYRWEDVPAEVEPDGFCAWGKRKEDGDDTD